MKSSFCLLVLVVTLASASVLSQEVLDVLPEGLDGIPEELPEGVSAKMPELFEIPAAEPLPILNRVELKKSAKVHASVNAKSVLNAVDNFAPDLEGWEFLFNDPRSSIVGWKSEIDSIDLKDGRVEITARVRPVLAGPAVVNGEAVEVYQLKDGKLQQIKRTPPKPAIFVAL